MMAIVAQTFTIIHFVAGVQIAVLEQLGLNMNGVKQRYKNFLGILPN
jgi:hypothetical protein